jgi:hypothetical protein
MRSFERYDSCPRDDISAVVSGSTAPMTFPYA